MYSDFGPSTRDHTKSISSYKEGGGVERDLKKVTSGLVSNSRG